MKISKIKFNGYLHFRPEYEIDLTYPEGCGDKSGKPLDKVCFIGQSGTGKTSILNLLKYFTAEGEHIDTSGIDFEKLGQGCVEIEYKIGDRCIVKSPVGAGEKRIVYKESGRTLLMDFKKEFEALVTQCEPKLIFFPFNVIPHDKAFPIKPEQNVTPEVFDKIIGDFEANKSRRIWDLTSSDLDLIINLILTHIDRYIDEHAIVAAECINNQKKDRENGDKYIGELIQWEETHPNPIADIANMFLTELLAKLGLVIETDVQKYYTRESKSRKDIDNVFILKQGKEQVKFSFLSTGTKQLILTALPLYFLKPKKSIIFFDQPEASLYPDMQLLLATIYSKLANDSQFFYASHSPIVASAFDPWEVVILKFDQKGFVYREQYLKHGKTGKHIDDYQFNHKLFSWDSIFQRIFGLEHLRPEPGIKELQRLAEVEQEIKEAQKKENPDVDQLKEKYKSIADSLDWNLK